MNYTVTAWLLDKRCNCNCNLKTYDTDSLEDAMIWINKIKKAWGDSVMLYDRLNNKIRYIELRNDQRV